MNSAWRWGWGSRRPTSLQANWLGIGKTLLFNSSPVNSNVSTRTHNEYHHQETRNQLHIESAILETWQVCNVYNNQRQHIKYTTIKEGKCRVTHITIYSGTSEERTLWERHFCPFLGGCPSLGGSWNISILLLYNIMGWNISNVVKFVHQLVVM